MTDLRLIIFDVDGTLVDSQNDIMASMRAAYAAQRLPAPDRIAVLGIVGLSLHAAFARLSPALSPSARDELAEVYKQTYTSLRHQNGADGSPLYPGARELLDQFHADPHMLLAIATGKSRRGLEALLESHGLERHFVSRQTADDHPSKPHPSMIEACLAEAGVRPQGAVMVGDTTYDVQMAHAASVRAIGVGWGYHPVQQLGADVTIDDFAQLPAAIGTLLDDAA